MKESGINYFFTQLALNTGFWPIYYTFEEGAGNTIYSVSGAQSGYSGILSSNVGFWIKGGSGYSSGTSIAIQNASGLHSETWTKFFVYEKVNTQDCILFDSLSPTSGHRIGLTKANKLYFESFNSEPIVASFENNLSSKNALYVGYFTNFVTFGLYNFNSKQIESQSFSYPFEVVRSDNQVLGGNFTGWWDQYIHYTEYLSPDVAGQWLSGLYAYPTGIGYDTEYICVTGITGYQDVFVAETGVTGYQITPNGDEGQGFFTGQFPLFNSVVSLTGYLSTGIISSGLTGTICYAITGIPYDIYEYKTGYAASFGMEKIQLFTPLIRSDIVKSSWSYEPFYDIYNKIAERNYSGYLMSEEYPTGLLNLYYNGVGQAGSGWSTTGFFIIVTGTSDRDIITFDLKSGNKLMLSVTGQTTIPIFYSGQEIYLNGVNLISGYDFQAFGNSIIITGNNTGIYGDVFEYPIVLPYTTGNSTIFTGSRFWRDSSNQYLNGIRQQIYSLYTEGAIFDLLSGNSFTYSGVEPIYNRSQLYWEH